MENIRVTIDTPLYEDFNTTVSKYGEFIFCVRLVNNEPVLDRAYTKALSLDIIRKYTFDLPYSSIKVVYNLENVPSYLDLGLEADDTVVPVIDLRVKEVAKSYSLFRKVNFPVSYIRDKYYSLLEVIDRRDLYLLLKSSIEALAVSTCKSIKKVLIKSGMYDYYGRDERSTEDYISDIKKSPVFCPLNYFCDMYETDSFIELVKEINKFETIITEVEITEMACSHTLLYGNKKIMQEFHCNYSPKLLGDINIFEYTSIGKVDINNESPFIYTIKDNERAVKIIQQFVGPWFADLDNDKICISGGIIAGVAYCTYHDVNVTDYIYKHYPYIYTRLIIPEGESGKNYYRRANINIQGLPNAEYDVYEEIIKVTAEEGYVYNFDYKPGPDIDMPILTDNEEELMEIAYYIYEKVSKYYDEELTIEKVTEGRATPIYRITGSLQDMLFGFRTIEIYMSDGWNKVITYHVPFVRGMYNKGKISVSSSLIHSVITQSIQTYHEHISKKTDPKEIMNKYMQRMHSYNCLFRNKTNWCLANQFMYGNYNILNKCTGFGSLD